jgi:mRNA degradation ribonuclease J1/J2
MIDQIKPKSIFPVHTQNPQMFKKISRNAKTIRAGKAYTV